MKIILPIAIAFLASASINADPKDDAPKPPETQTHIVKGHVEAGYSSEMVVAALGKPSRTFARIANNEDLEIWSWRRHCWPCAPAYEPMISGAWTAAGLTAYGLEDNERARVVFLNGRVIGAEIR